jgi:hypothetical protein
MTHLDQTSTAAAGHSARARKRHQRRGRPGPFPVTVVRPATVAVEPLTPTQRARQRAANEMAREITEASRDGTRPDLGAHFPLSLRYYSKYRNTLQAIVPDALALAANPPAGAVRIGRNLRGHVVVAVLHATTWSLLLCPAQPHPAVWAFLDQFGPAALWFCSNGDLLSVQWTEMTDTVFTALNT